MVYLWYIHIMEYYSAMKSNELLINREPWIVPIILCWVKEARPKMDNILYDSIYVKSLEVQTNIARGLPMFAWG